LYTALFRKYGTPAFKKALGGGKPYKLWDEIKANLRGKGRISPEVLFFTESMDMLGIVGRIAGFAHFDKLEAIRQQFLDMMQPGGVILCPLLLTEPPKHGWNWLLGIQPPYTIMFNALGFPAVVLPIHYNTKKSLPMAVQIVARPDEDEVALAVAAELERVYGGWQMAQVL
jgi:Asp-tRNA(Asn)/Glu-tRNA(Gln) amidotransferase A subunit family amidase